MVYVRKIKGIEYLYHDFRINGKDRKVYLGRKDGAEVNRVVHHLEKQILNMNEPKTKTIPIDLLKGLTQEQKDLIINLTQRFKHLNNFSPLAFSVDIETGNVYYFNKVIAFTKPIKEIKDNGIYI